MSKSNIIKELNELITGSEKLLMLGFGLSELNLSMNEDPLVTYINEAVSIFNNLKEERFRLKKLPKVANIVNDGDINELKKLQDKSLADNILITYIQSEINKLTDSV